MRSKPNLPIKRLLAKLPRSWSGSRDASASSSAAAFPADIFDVSMMGAEPGFGVSFMPVSALMCSGGASNGVFIRKIAFQAVLADRLQACRFCSPSGTAGLKPAGLDRQDAYLPNARGPQFP